MSHYEKRLAHDLSVILDRVSALSTQVGRALLNSQEALFSGDETTAYRTVLGDHVINKASREIDRLCHAFIARHLPSAGHLRQMSSIIRVNVALERIGDYAVTIGRESVQRSCPPTGNLAKELHSLGEEARRLLGESVSAFNEGDAEKARVLMPLPERIESAMDGVYSELIEHSTGREPRDIVADFVVFNLFKRIADQAKNICDQTVFATLGEIKPPKVFHILFVDEVNSVNAQMAEALARKRFPNVAEYANAGQEPLDNASPQLLEFLETRGVDAEGLTTRGIDSAALSLASYDVVVGLAKPLKENFPQLPFHTSALSWDLPGDSSEHDEATEGLAEVYRVLVAEIDDLMGLLLGENDN